MRKKRRKSLKPPVSQTYWADEQDVVFTGVEPAHLRSLVKQHGDFSLAYSTMVQPCIRHFGDEDGYVAWRSRWGVTFALGDPVVEPGKLGSLLDRFSDARKGMTGLGPTFCQISSGVAQVLHDRGYSVNEMGVDTSLMLDDYTLGGKSKEWLRYAFNWTQRRGYQIRECDSSEVSAADIEEISEAWRKTRTVKRKEVRFLNRPIVVEEEQDVRKFYLFGPDNRALAFVYLDPLYRDGKITGYVTVIKRRHPEAPQYAEHAIMKYVIETLKEEGVSRLNLGLSPMAWLEDNRFRHSWLSRRGFELCYRSSLVNKWFYNLVGHAEYKRRFRGQEEKVYIASPTRVDTMRMFALIGLCGIA